MLQERPDTDDLDGLPPMGNRHHRSWVGPPEYYDRIGILQLFVLVLLGMRENHTLLDIGCGSLRGGRFAITYLRQGHYFGVDPEAWAVEQGIAYELSEGARTLKQPSFAFNDAFDASQFDVEFDFALASGIFMHTSRSQITQCFRAIQPVLAADGVFIGAYLKGAKDSECDRWTYPEIQHYTQDGIRRLAEAEGLQAHFPEWPHPFDHRWFVLTHQTSARTVPATLDLSLFSWTEYLQHQLERAGGTPRSYQDYLKHDLAAATVGRSRDAILPQAFEPDPA